MGCRAGKVPLSQASFDFIPEKLKDIEFSQIDELQQTYENCYRVMFDKELSHVPDKVVRKDNNAHAVILQACRDNRCTVKLFILTVMYGFKLKNDSGAKFHSNMLLGPGATNRLTRFRQEVEATYGSFDTKALSLFANEDFSTELVEQQLLDSEIEVGSWVVGFKLKFPGKIGKDLYQSLEFSLSPYWLALEDHYWQQVFTPWLAERFGTVSEIRHRIEVSKIVALLKKRRKSGLNLFRLRGQIMPKAIEAVLGRHNLTPDDFEIPTTPVKSSIDLWVKLGLAIQQIHCLSYYHDHNAEALRKLGAARA